MQKMKLLQKLTHPSGCHWQLVTANLDTKFTQVLRPISFVSSRDVNCWRATKDPVSCSHMPSLNQCRRNTSYLCQSWSRQKWHKKLLSVNCKPYICNGRHSLRHLSQQTTASDENVKSVEDTSSNASTREHIPVMVEEVLEHLVPQEGQVIVDMTFGAGGHAKEILSRTAGLKYIASDRDPYAHGLATKQSENCMNGEVLIPVLSRFSELPYHLNKLGIAPGSVDGFLFDLGASSMQYDQAARGFALSKDGPLDMRMDSQRFPESITAADVVNHLSSQDLAHIIKKYGEESRCHHIANAIVEARYALGHFTRTQQLAEVVKSVFDSMTFRHDKLFRQSHLATKTFQALRIFVNNELNEIHNGIEVARHFLKQGGRCVVISFHSLEDRIIKRHFHGIDMDEKSNTTIHHHFRNSIVSHDLNLIKEDYMSRLWRPVSRKVHEPSLEECLRNPRARSAKLRAAVREDFVLTDD